MVTLNSRNDCSPAMRIALVINKMVIKGKWNSFLIHSNYLSVAIRSMPVIFKNKVLCIFTATPIGGPPWDVKWLRPNGLVRIVSWLIYMISYIWIFRKVRIVSAFRFWLKHAHKKLIIRYQHTELAHCIVRILNYGRTWNAFSISSRRQRSPKAQSAI